MSNKVFKNKLHQTIENLANKPFGQYLVNLALGFKIPYVRTSSLNIVKMTPQEVVISLANRRSVRNPIGQVHAAAMMLLGETASGLLAGMNISDNSLPLIKEMKTKFIKRFNGNI